MNNDELQVLGAEAIQKRKRWWRKVAMGAVLTVVAVIAIELSLRWSMFGFGAIDDHAENSTSTIVPSLQHAVDSLLNEELELINGLQGQAIVMEVQTGEILAMVGLERNFEGRFQPCKNFAYQQELGSLMKTASLLAVLETGKASLSDVVNTGGGVWPIDDEQEMTDHNWRRGGYGDITLEQALAVDSNIGIGRTVARVFGNDQQHFFDLLSKMSFGQPDSIAGVEGLKTTYYSSPQDTDWLSRKIWWSAIGYGRKIAPVQMLTFYNAIANGGKMVKPTLKTGEVEVINPQIASKANIDSIQVALEHVVSQGLGKKAENPFFLVAGIPATSQVCMYGYYNDGGVPLNEYQLAFCGYFPADAPKYSIIVSMNKLGLPASGGGMAGVVFHNIMEWMLYHDMPKILVYDEETGDTLKLKETDFTE
ncbi:MAG: penicillin-binding protein [Prevotella sp.]|nr:penicillin-binding protein [Prevotella sp.]